MATGELIEAFYWDRRELGGQSAQHENDFEDRELTEAFAATAEDVQALRAAGPFYPEASRTPLIELARRAGLTGDQVADTEHLQAMLWQPLRWAVDGMPGLDFEFLAREITPISSVRGRERVWLVNDARRRLSVDALLVTAEDRTPIVAEIKVGGDENAELALVQALAGAAQLSSPPQLRRLHRQFRDALGKVAPSRLDVYVITACAPSAGVRLLLADRAHARARRLAESGALDEWVRRIVFLEAAIVDGRPQFGLANGFSTSA